MRHRPVKPPKPAKTRRLSPWRVLLALILIGGLSAGGVAAARQWRANQTTSSTTEPWFASYVDVTATPQFGFEQLGTTTSNELILSFIVASLKDSCTPSWGGAYTISQASAQLDLDRRIARLQQLGGNVAVSFGGLDNQELSTSCTDESKLLDAYTQVVDHYNLNTIDLDLELSNLTDSTAAYRRAHVIANLQTKRREAGKSLAVWVTLPVTPQGLSEDGTKAIASLLKGGVDIAGVNIMTMDYGQSRPAGQDMAAASIAALEQTKRQLGILYEQAGTYLSSASLWRKLGATPMIGQNDIQDEVFTLDNAKALNQFAHQQGISRLSMWSANRDIACGSNYVNLSVVSDSCSGVKQDKFAFITALEENFTGSMTGRSSDVTKADTKPSAAELTDDPATSPYQVWSDKGTYLQGTKVVWHKNVYQAKWWTTGEVPDNPVLQSWQTPWELIGPVLPGEKPIPQLTLPAGTYPEWSGEVAYEAQQRVLFQGIPFQAKWWNRGDSPAAASSDPNASPWVPLTQTEINEVVDQHKN